MAISTSLTLKFNGSSVQKGLAKLSASMKKFGDGALKVGGGLAAFGAAGLAGIIAVGAKLNAIGEEAKASDARLKSITAQMGLFGDKSKKVADRLLDLADAQARMTGVDDDIIAGTQAKLMTFAELAKSADTAGGAFDRATMAAVDMAAAGFGSAEQNAVQLGKALNDPIKGINSLTRSGITFTAEQKKLIASLVETGQAAKAQDVVLKAIEKQVGGTAAATATASSKIQVSLSQIVEAFAKPFSSSFDSLPRSMDSVFPQLEAKAAEAGRIVSASIAEAIAGDSGKLEMIGDLIGESIKAGIFASLQSLSGEVLKFLANFGQTNSEKISRTNAKIDEIGGTTGELLSANMSNGRVPDLIKSLRESVGPKFGTVPDTGGKFRYANPGETSIFSDGQGNKVIELLTGINQKLSPQP